MSAEASVAGGPVGRDARAATDIQLTAEILSYSRTQGLFAGINLSGGVLRTDHDDTATCGKRLDIVAEVGRTDQLEDFVKALTSITPAAQPPR